MNVSSALLNAGNIPHVGGLYSPAEKLQPTTLRFLKSTIPDAIRRSIVGNVKKKKKLKSL